MTEMSIIIGFIALMLVGMAIGIATMQLDIDYTMDDAEIDAEIRYLMEVKERNRKERERHVRKN